MIIFLCHIGWNWLSCNRHNRDVKILLEVGCGNGSNLIIAERILNCRCIGIDLAPSAIKFANKGPSDAKAFSVSEFISK